MREGGVYFWRDRLCVFIFAACPASSVALYLTSPSLLLVSAGFPKVASPSAKNLVFESAHPYMHNADQKQAVRVEGAKKLMISFDERSRWGKLYNSWYMR